MKIKRIFTRIYSDYFLPDRFKEYETLMESALKNNYIITSVIGFYDGIKNGEFNYNSKIIINRHDIDTDPLAAVKFLEVERKFNIKASYYFRLSTINKEIIDRILIAGCEVGYHYEELATYLKRNRIRDKSIIEKDIPIIQNEFVKNYLNFCQLVKVPVRSIASHGDFVNRIVGITNKVIISLDLKKRLAIDVEAYDDIIKKDSFSVSDTTSPYFWKPRNPEELISEGEKLINLLTHTRHWRGAPIINTKENFIRFWEGLNYSLIKK